MALGTLGAVAGGLAAGSVGGGFSDSTSINSGLGLGVNSGSSYEEGAGSNWGNESSWSESSSYYKQYGSEASAKDIERASEANKLNEKWIDKNLAFQERMSNTSYQRLVNDLLAAGINPRAIYSGLAAGSTTPGGAITGAAKAQTFPDIESESHSSSGSEGSSGGSYYNVGGSEQNGVNININSGKTESHSVPTAAKVWNALTEGAKYGKGFDGYDMPTI